MTKKRDLFQRPGRVSIFDTTQNQEELQLIQSKMFLHSIEYNTITGNLEYWGYSKMFDKRKEGEVTPYYMFWFTANYDLGTNKIGRLRISRAERIKEGEPNEEE